MFRKYRNFIFLGLLGLFSIPLIAMDKPQKGMTVFDLIQEEHTSSIDDEKQKKPFMFEVVNKDGTPRDPTPEEFIRFEYEMQLYKPFSAQFAESCGILNESGYFTSKHEHLLIDAATREDLKILRGSQKGKDLPKKDGAKNAGADAKSQFDCLANKVNCTFTFAGKAVLCSQLAQPPSSVEQLTPRRSKIESLLKLHKDSSANYNTLETAINKAAAGESAFLSFYDPGDRFADYLRRRKTELFASKKIELVKRLENWLNHNPLYLYYQEAKPIVISVPGLAFSALIKICDFGKIFFGPDKLKNCMKFFK